VNPTPHSDVRRAFRALDPLGMRGAVILLVAFGVVRVALVLQSNVTATYQAVGAIFVVMALLPWVLLTRDGRRRIGLVRPRWRWLPVALLAGAASSVLIFAIATVVWGLTTSNPFVYVSLSYSAVPDPLPADDRIIFFAIFAAIGMLFSPLGEEVLYRGIAHTGLATRLGGRGASLVDAGAFAVVHLAHFGIVYLAGAWAFLPGPAAYWLLAMFGVSLLFTAFRILSRSLGGAIVAHAGFNLAMTACIFFTPGVL
jgi:membrane protease YdiL (CAAX protease family)